MSTRRAPTRPHESEAGFMRAVIDLARLHGWRVYHTWKSFNSAAGFPDLVLVRPPRVVFAELKREKGRLSPPQEAWLDALSAAGADTYVWRPSQWSEVVEVLRRGEV